MMQTAARNDAGKLPETNIAYEHNQYCEIDFIIDRRIFQLRKKKPAESFYTVGRATTDYLFFYYLKPYFSIVICLSAYQLIN